MTATTERPPDADADADAPLPPHLQAHLNRLNAVCERIMAQHPEIPWGKPRADWDRERGAAAAPSPAADK